MKCLMLHKLAFLLSLLVIAAVIVPTTQHSSCLRC